MWVCRSRFKVRLAAELVAEVRGQQVTARQHGGDQGTKVALMRVLGGGKAVTVTCQDCAAWRCPSIEQTLKGPGPLCRQQP